MGTLVRFTHFTSLNENEVLKTEFTKRIISLIEVITREKHDVIDVADQLLKMKMKIFIFMSYTHSQGVIFCEDS